MPTTRSGRVSRRVSPDASITSPEFVARQVDLDRPIVEEASDNSFASPMADQQQTNNAQGSASREGDEELTVAMNVQMEMLKALKEAREGQGMMMNMMLNMQKQQEEMASFRQQMMQIPAFKAMFPGSSQQQQHIEVEESDKNHQNISHGREAQQIPVVNLEPQQSGEGVQQRAEANLAQQPLVPINPQMQIPPISIYHQQHNQQHNQQPILQDASVHQHISIPPAPQMNQNAMTSQKAPGIDHYVTKEDMMDLINQMKRQSTRPAELDFTPPYPAYIRRQPYPAGYIEHPPQFPKYSGGKGNAREHIAKFVESMSPWLGIDEVSNHNILLREFNKTLTDGAFSWYYNLEKGSIRDWDDMKLQFFKKFFYVQKQVSIVELMRIQQKSNEDLSDYVDRFRAQAQKCVEPIEERNLVGICNNGALDTFKPHLITKACDSFATLSSFAQNLGGIESLLKSQETIAWKSKQTATMAFADSQPKPQGGKRKRNETNTNWPEPEAITCSEETFKDLYDQWIKDGVVKPPKPRFMVSEEMKKRSDFCVYHQYPGHSTMNCRNLRRIYHEKLAAGEIELE